MVLSDAFLGQKMPEFQASIPQLRGKTPIETFTYVNTKLRAENFQTIQSVCRKTEPRQLWQDTFIRMKNAAPMALFGDRRTYFYAGKPVGDSIHTGVDLASLAHAPIEACGVREVKGYGRQKSYLDEYHGSEYSLAYLPKVEITLWVDDLRVEEVVRTVVEVARTGRMGDGKIFVMPAMEDQPW